MHKASILEKQHPERRKRTLALIHPLDVIQPRAVTQWHWGRIVLAAVVYLALVFATSLLAVQLADQW